MEKKNKCAICGWEGNKTHLHHVIPIKDGGEDLDENLIEICPNCHSEATVDEYTFRIKYGLKGVKMKECKINAMNRSSLIWEQLLNTNFFKGLKLFNELLELETKYNLDNFYKKTTRIKIPGLTNFEFGRLISKTKKLPFKIAFILSYGSGLRMSEIVGGERVDGSKIKSLTKEDISIKDKIITIRNNGSNRLVPLSDKFKESMLDFLPLNKFYSNNSSLIRSLQRGFKISANKSGLLEHKPSVCFQSLRHGFAITLIKKSIPLDNFRKLMGASSLTFSDFQSEDINEGRKKIIEEYKQLSNNG